MVKPIDAKWAIDTLSDGNLNKTTYGQGTAFPSTWLTDRLFWRTDQNLLYKNKGTEGTPIWDPLTESDINQVYPLSVTIGDYTTPAVPAVGSTEKIDGTATSISFFDLFSNNTNWTQVGGEVTVDSGGNNKVVMATNAAASDERVHRALGLTLNDGASGWVAEFQYKAMTQADGIMYPLVFTAGTLAPTITANSQDAIGCLQGDASSNRGMRSWYKDGAGTVNMSGFSSALTADTTYWVRLIRTSTTNVDLKIYTDASFSTQHGSTVSFTIPSTVTGLTTCQIVGQDTTGARATNAEMDNLYVVNASTTVTIIQYYPDDSATDGEVATNWKSTSSTNPNIYIDTGSAQEIVAIAINLDRTATTETQIEIRYSTDTTFTSPEVVRTLLVSDFTDDVLRYIILPRQVDDRRYIQIYGVSTGVVLSINDIKYRARTTAIINREHFHTTLSSTDVSDNELDSN